MIGAPQVLPEPKAAPSTSKPGTVLLHPDGRPGDPDACRIIARTSTHGDWPWMRLTGRPQDVPSRGDELRGWTVQPLELVGRVLGT